MITLLALSVAVQASLPGAAAQTASPDSRAGDLVYSSPAVRALVTAAAAANRRPPPSLDSYSARVETELSFVRVESDGRETVLQIEQVASDLAWTADGGLLLELLGYRSQMLGPSFSALSFYDIPWVVPSLYGERLDFIRTSGPVYDDEGRLLVRRALHPLSERREEVYRFSGGDTVLVLRLPGRTVPIVRVHVEPVAAPELPTLLFEGDVDIDLTRMHVVSMQGRIFVEGRGGSFLDALAQGVTYVRLDSGEYDEAYWLPREQRFEVQAISRLGEGRVVFRAVSRFLGVLPNDAEAAARVPSPDEHPSGLLTGAEDMSRLSSFGGWRLAMGELNETATARDFDRYGPSIVARTGEPRLTFGTRQLSQIVRFNDIEGLFTGGGLTFDFGDAAPGLRARAHAGWAWEEGALRGGVELERRTDAWDLALRAERQLAHTHDFLYGLTTESDEVPIIGAQGFTYVDRRLASAVARRFREGGLGVRAEVARVRDRGAGPAPEQVNDGGSIQPTGPLDLEQVLRGSLAGDYWRGRAEVRLNPSAGRFSLRPGLFLRLAWEGAVEAGSGGAGAGDGATGRSFDWQRLEAGAAYRKRLGRWTVALAGDAGLVLADAPPPQALFELGVLSDVPGADETTFAGDRAALGRATVLYALPVLGAPIRIGAMWIPAPEPSPGVGVRLGWTDASAETRGAMGSFGWQTSGGVRSSLDLRMRFFGGGLSVGAARPLEEGGEWRFVWGLVGNF